LNGQIAWAQISDDLLVSLYHQKVMQPTLGLVKQEISRRGILNSNFEAILTEKEKEIEQLKGELEKYKMSEKLATSILESPYNYNSASAIVRRKQKQGDFMEQSYGSSFKSGMALHSRDNSFACDVGGSQ